MTYWKRECYYKTNRLSITLVQKGVTWLYLSSSAGLYIILDVAGGGLSVLLVEDAVAEAAEVVGEVDGAPPWFTSMLMNPSR